VAVALVAAAPSRALGVLWRFSRPHTVIGTAVSVAGLFAVAAAQLPGPSAAEGAFHLFWTLVAALCVNVFIVGINQIADVEIDRINKPALPLAAGELSPEGATRIVAGTAVVAVALALTQGLLELVAVAAALLVGVAYSLPPLRLKRFPTLASLCVSGVRAAIVNLGVYAHFSAAFAGGPEIAGPVWALTVFVLPFGVAIAILKDVPDLEGDRRHRIATFTVRFGGRRVLRAGLAALTLAYAGMIVLGPLLVRDWQPAVLVAGHAAALALLWRWSRGVDAGDRASFTRFYLRVWKLFFAEYAIVAVACLAT
jgi:homogentisate phytyltransferase / homogentisate geranylgeranyltransferase